MYCQNKIQDNCNSVKTTRVNNKDATPQLGDRKRKKTQDLEGPTLSNRKEKNRQRSKAHTREESKRN